MKKILVSFLACYSLFSYSQKQADVSLELLDGNILKGTAMVNDVELVTAYGKLVIPVSKISHIEVGIGRDAAVAEKAKSHLKILATSNIEDTRKGAYADLVKLGIKAIPAINDFYNDPKNISEESTYTGEFTIDNALSEIKSSANLTHEAPMEDILTMDNNYTMGGTYTFTKMDIKTEYGSLSVPKEKIKSIDVSVAVEPGKGEFSYKLTGAKNISGNTSGGWLKTGVTLKSGQRFTITANGEVTLASLSNSKYKPDGSSKAEGATDYTKPYNSGEEGEYSTGGYPTYGQVVYKIGEASTETLKAGAKFSGTAKTSGVLMIAIYETVFNANNKGAYNVKVSLGK
ncbi:MAG: hypothetical protein H0W61_03470 [Bacteroidetes bacterium]|nr:hypothetical protein [Bacteroidota bacterium]